MARNVIASRTDTASTTVDIAGDFGSVPRANWLLKVSAAGTLVTDLLDIYLQFTPDEGTTWQDFAHFTQVLGNGGAKAFLASWQAGVAPASLLGTISDGALAAGVRQGPIAKTLRCKVVIVNGGGTHSFTWELWVDAPVFDA